MVYSLYAPWLACSPVDSQWGYILYMAANAKEIPPAISPAIKSPSWSFETWLPMLSTYPTKSQPRTVPSTDLPVSKFSTIQLVLVSEGPEVFRAGRASRASRTVNGILRDVRVADDGFIRARGWKPNARRDQGSLALDGLDDERIADALSVHCWCCVSVVRIPWDIGDDIP